MTSMEELNNHDKTSPVDVNGWGIDKRVPLTFIFVVVVQTIVITWGAATLAGDVKNYGEKIIKLERDFSNFVDKADDKFMTRASCDLVKQNVSSEIANIKEDIKTLDDRVHRLETHLK